VWFGAGAGEGLELVGRNRWFGTNVDVGDVPEAAFAIALFIRMH
jgi:hypothetical protein